MHFSNPFDITTGSPVVHTSQRPIAAFATDSLIDAIDNDNTVIAITAGTKYATDLDRVADAHPINCIDPGMSEQHAVSMAVGMTLQNYYPVLNYQSTFMQRAYDQLIHDVAYTNKPIMVLLSRSGFAGYDNPTHHGIYDFSYLKGIPNIRIIYPANVTRLSEIVSNEVREKKGPVIICYPYGFEDEFDFDPNKELMQGSKLLLTTGNLAGAYQKYKLELNIKNVDIFAIEEISPLDGKTLSNLLSRYSNVLSVEESVEKGGLNESLASLIISSNLKLKFEYAALDNIFYPGGSTRELRTLAGISPEHIFTKLQGM